MLVYDVIQRKADRVFRQGRLELPTTEAWEERLSRIKSLNDEKSKVIYDFRRWQAKELGFPQVTMRDIVEGYMGSWSTGNHKEEKTSPYDWMYNHHTGRNEGKRWHRAKHFWYRYESKGFFAWPPYGSKLAWGVQVVKLNDLQQEIPYGVMLKVLEVKALKIFNAFHVIEVNAPAAPVRKPLLLGSIFELPPSNHKTKFDKTGLVGHFLICDWYE